MRKRAVVGVTFASGVIAIDVEHIRQCGLPGEALVETLETATHEYAHYKHRRWGESRITRWWQRRVLPRRHLLVEFVKGVE